MKRSEINALLQDAVQFLDTMQVKLPPFAYFTPEEWRYKGPEYDEIRDNMLGWDITDFGSGDFRRVGLLLFTLRNGNTKKSAYTKTYAEKILIVEEEQITPYHFHWQKMEDIINRGGGNLEVRLYNSEDSGALANTPVAVSMDGRRLILAPGETIVLSPGESITLTAGLYHEFKAQKSSGKVLLGEVSQVNDDHADNRFYQPAGRFPKIEEDCPPLFLLCGEY